MKSIGQRIKKLKKNRPRGFVVVRNAEKDSGFQGLGSEGGRRRP
jgi:hypothetical protein